MPKSAIAALTATVALVGLGGYIALGFLAGDTDRYGRVAVPGGEALELERGEVDLFYAEDVSLGEDEDLAVPGDLEVRVAAADREPLEIRLRGGQQVSGGGGTATLIGSIDVADAGIYEVATRSAAAAGRRVPEVTLGESPFDAAGERVANVLGVAVGPVGAVALALFALLAIIAWVRARSTLRGPKLPPGAAGSA